jgi:predicted nucleic acid-binding protein
MNTIFLDTNILLDVFSQRVPFYPFSARVLTLVEQQYVIGCTSSLNFSNLFYILRKQRSREVALTHLRQLASFIKILTVDEQVITQALHSSFKDFEDAIQYYTAKGLNIKFLITHNTKDYASVDSKLMQVVTAEEYLQLWDASTVSPTSKRTKKPRKTR